MEGGMTDATKLKLCILGFILVCLGAWVCPGQTVKLAWDASETNQPITYVLYESMNVLSDATIATATTNVLTGTNLTVTVSGLLAGNWWFAVAARDTNGIQSLLSNVLQIEVPKPPLNMRTVVLQYSGTLSNFYDVGFFKLRLP
jgi:hypothetical protein